MGKVVAQWKEGVEGAETPLDRLRQRIVHFLGSLGGSVNGWMIETGSAAMRAAKVVAWDNRNKLKFALPFQDMKPSIYLGTFACPSSPLLSPPLLCLPFPFSSSFSLPRFIPSSSV